MSEQEVPGGFRVLRWDRKNMSAAQKHFKAKHHPINAQDKTRWRDYRLLNVFKWPIFYLNRGYLVLKSTCGHAVSGANLMRLKHALRSNFDLNLMSVLDGKSITHI